MGIRGISDPEAERLLDGGRNGGNPRVRIGETAAFLRVARPALLERPPPELEAELVRRLAETARLGAASRATAPQPIFRSRRRLVADRSDGEGAAGTSSEQPSSSKATGASQGNSDAAHKKALENRSKARGKAIGHERGRAIGLKGLEPPGHTGDTGPPVHSNAGGSPTSESAPGKVMRISPPRTRGRGTGLSRGQGLTR